MTRGLNEPREVPRLKGSVVDAERPDDLWRTVGACLDPFERRALQMIYLDGLTQREVAAVLRTGQPAVARAVAHAMHVVAALVLGSVGTQEIASAAEPHGGPQ